jgi:XTP/dITP diphosphohydrolase
MCAGAFASEQTVLVTASNNPHKLRELGRMFGRYRIVGPAAVGCPFEYEERGGSYLENALGKAMHLFGLLRRPVLADDSGLEVPALGGEPGIFSSRYGSPDGRGKLSDAERNAFLLSRAAKLEQRACRFVCCMVLVLEENRFAAAQETLPGVLARSPSGSGGFGYDPLVYLPEKGKTVAELADREKDAISHRGKAARRILALMQSL